MARTNDELRKQADEEVSDPLTESAEWWEERDEILIRLARADALRGTADDDELLEVGRRAVEDALVDMRDSRMFTLRNNGLVIKERDGSDSDVIRFGPEVALRIGLRAIADAVREKEGGAS